MVAERWLRFGGGVRTIPLRFIPRLFTRAKALHNSRHSAAGTIVDLANDGLGEFLAAESRQRSRRGAGAAAGIGAGGFLGGLRNGSMGAYWARMPGVQAMPQIWVYELEKRVRAGKLSRDDAIGIFNTAVLGAEAQGFKPTGDRMSLVHKSAVDFLGQAEAVYFARKKAKAAEDVDSKSAEAKPERVTGEALAKARSEFEGMKRQLWKQEAERNPHKYTPEQLDKMRRGDAPTGSDGRPMEIHHKHPLSEGGLNTWDNFEFLTHTDHRRKPNFKPNHPNLPRGRAQ